MYDKSKLSAFITAVVVTALWVGVAMFGVGVWFAEISPDASVDLLVKAAAHPTMLAAKIISLLLLLCFVVFASVVCCRSAKDEVAEEARFLNMLRQARSLTGK